MKKEGKKIKKFIQVCDGKKLYEKRRKSKH